MTQQDPDIAAIAPAYPGPGGWLARRLGWSGQPSVPNGITRYPVRDPGPEAFRGVDPVKPRVSTPNLSGMWAPNWRGGDNTNNDQIVRDRHPYWWAGYERAGRGSNNGPHDPIPDGPVRPSLHALNRTWTKWVGSDNTRNLDPPRGYHWLGEQGAKFTPIYGGQYGYYLPAGQRGGPGVDTVPGITGPSLIMGDYPHGLHSRIPLDRLSWAQSAAQYRSRPQQVPARQDRLANSNVAGQSYSQTTQRQAATGPAGGRAAHPMAGR